MAQAPNYSLNVSSTDKCWPCDDTGYVELRGTITRHGVAYSRGTAPCKWCEQGRKRYARLVELRQNPESNFGIEDVEGWDADDRPVSAAEAKRYIAAIQAQWAKPKPAERAMRPETDADIEAKRERARRALEEPSRQEAAAATAAASQQPSTPSGSEPAGTVELPPDPPPIPTQPDYSDVPF